MRAQRALAAAALCLAMSGRTASAQWAAPGGPLRLSLRLLGDGGLGEPLVLRVGLLPAGGLQLGEVELQPVRVGLNLTNRYLDLSLAAGSHLADDGSAALSLVADLRLGKAEGVNLRARYGYSLQKMRLAGGPRWLRIGPRGSLTVPLTPRLAFKGEGVFTAGKGLTTIGVKHRLAGDGGPDSWFVSAGIGLSFLREDNGCSAYGRGYCLNPNWSAAPTVIFGIERKF